MRPKTHAWLCAFPDTARHWIGQRVYNLRMPEYTIDKCPSVYNRQMSEHHDGLELLEQETEPSTRQKRRPQEKRYVSKFSVSIDNRQYLRRLEKPPMKFRRGDAKETRTMTAGVAAAFMRGAPKCDQTGFVSAMSTLSWMQAMNAINK